MIACKHLWVTALLIPLFISGCSTQPTSQLHGKISLHEGWKPVVYLVQPLDLSLLAANFSGKVVDSVQIAPDGSFAFHAPANPEASSGLFQLVVQPVGSRYPTRLTDQNPVEANYMPVVWNTGQSIDIQSDIEHFQQSFSITAPSRENQALLRLRDLRAQAFSAQADILTNQEHDETTLLKHEDALLHFREPLMAFADTTQVMQAAMVAIRWVSPESDYERVPEFLARQCQKWQKLAPETPFVQQLCRNANPEKLPLQTGQFMPDFPLPMLSGDIMQLKKLLGARLTIVDLWASWCGPCRRENRETLVPIWHDYRAKGLQIIGYSIDSSPAAWKAAIAKDGADWPHASHLTGDSTPFMDALKISTIPANFILDADGRVMVKNVYGEALKDWVANYLK